MAKEKAAKKVNERKVKYDQDKMKAAYLKNHDLGDVVKAVGCSRVYAHRRATTDGYYVKPVKKGKAADAKR
jgi:hypothetical protein